ncbi:MAG: LexA family transcriptional regulator [Alphaproteobacteria bacterium]|nr:LexA family transcriptional regulator [Alphaproteobacteria bacterium]
MNNIKKIRKEKGLSVTELAKAINMSQSNLTKIENNQLIPKDEVFSKIADILNVSKEILEDNNKKYDNYNMLPILNSTELGLPDLSLYPLPHYIFNQKPADLCVYIQQDDSMQPSINKNSVIIINKKQQTFQTNGLYLLKINNTYVLRRLQEIENNQIYLIADNKNYIYQTIEKESLEIVGVATHIFNFTPL